MSSSAHVLAPSLFMRVLALLAVLLAQPGLSALAVNLTFCVAGDCECAHEDEVDAQHASTDAHSEGHDDAKSCCSCHPHWLATPPRSAVGDALMASDAMDFVAAREGHPRGAPTRALGDNHPREMMRPPNA